MSPTTTTKRCNCFHVCRQLHSHVLCGAVAIVASSRQPSLFASVVASGAIQLTPSLLPCHSGPWLCLSQSSRSWPAVVPVLSCDIDRLACYSEEVDALAAAKTQHLADSRGPRPSTPQRPHQPVCPRRLSTRSPHALVRRCFPETFNRSGKGLHEFLLQRVFWKAFDDSARPRLAVQIYAPRPLLQGKKATDLFAVCLQGAPLLQERKCEGICITQSVFDRECFGSLTRLCLQPHEEHHQQHSSEPTGNCRLGGLSRMESCGVPPLLCPRDLCVS